MEIARSTKADRDRRIEMGRKRERERGRWKKNRKGEEKRNDEFGLKEEQSLNRLIKL